jgi:hypothetical protein
MSRKIIRQQKLFSYTFLMMERRHDIQHNDARHSDVRHNDTQHEGPISDTHNK